MKIENIIQNLQALNASTAEPAKKKSPSNRPSVAAAPKSKHLVGDESLTFSAARIVAAFELEKKGVTVEALVAGVRAYEGAYAGRVQ